MDLPFQDFRPAGNPRKPTNSHKNSPESLKHIENLNFFVANAFSGDRA